MTQMEEVSSKNNLVKNGDFLFGAEYWYLNKASVTNGSCHLVDGATCNQFVWDFVVEKTYVISFETHFSGNGNGRLLLGFAPDFNMEPYPFQSGEGWVTQQVRIVAKAGGRLQVTFEDMNSPGGYIRNIRMVQEAEVEPVEELIRGGDFTGSWQVKAQSPDLVNFWNGHCNITGNARIDQEFALKPETDYLLSCLAQFPKGGAGTAVLVLEPGCEVEILSIPGNPEWTTHTKNFVTPAGTTTGKLIVTGVGMRTDDVSITTPSKT